MKQRLTSTQIRSKLRWGVVGIFALLLVTLSYDVPATVNKGIAKINSAVALGLPQIPEKAFSLGLDLKGGAHLTYQADVNSVSQLERADAVEGARDVIERRVNALGVSEAAVQTTKVGDEYRIIVDLPGVQDVKQAIDRIGETPILEFREKNTEPPRVLTAAEEKQLKEYNDSAKKRIDVVAKELKSGKDFGTLVNEYSEDTQSKANGGYVGYVQTSLMYPEMRQWLEKAKPGDVSQAPIQTPIGYHIFKRGADRDGATEITASHILVCYLGATDCANPKYTKEEAKRKAEEIFRQANSSNFVSLVQEHSTDTVTPNGDLGTFGAGTMVKEFEDAAFAANAGQIIGPVETPFGYHVIYIRDKKPAKEYEFSHLVILTKSASDILPPHQDWKITGLSGSQLQRAEVVTDPNTGAVQVSLQFNAEGKELFRQITQRNIGSPVAIFLDGQPISTPTVQQTISDGRAVISGSFTVQEARDLARQLNAGALPVPVNLISQQTVGASLGAESLAKSLYAGVISILLVMVFMVLYYRLPGVLAVLALILYASLSLAIFKLVGITLTLAGIAGFILSIGMAVDANVLIFERMKEEFRDGKSLKAAVEEGFLRAWTSIRDSNISTLITCVALMWFGTSFVKGFAATLALGIMVSLFTAITVTRVFLRFVVPWFPEYGNWLFLGAKKPRTGEASSETSSV